MKARIMPALLLLILSLVLFASAACGGSETINSANVDSTPAANPGEGAGVAATPTPKADKPPGREQAATNQANNHSATGSGAKNSNSELPPTPKTEEPKKDDLNKKVGDLERTLNALKQKVDSLPANNETDYRSPGFWLPLAAGIISLLGLGALGYYMTRLNGKIDLAKKRLSAADKRLSEADKRLGKFDESDDETRESISTTKNLARRLDADLRELKEDVDIKLRTLAGNHQTLVEELIKQKQLNALGVTMEAGSPAPLSVASDGLDAPFSFPSSAAEYLKYLRRKGVQTVEAEADVVRGNNLVDKPEGQFLLVQDNNNFQRAYPVVPNLTRFTMSDEFMYYQHYFTCDNLSSGDVWIREPAYVVEDAVTRGWKLKTMGRLEVK